MGWDGNYGWRPYVPVAQRKSQGVSQAAKLAKKQGRAPSPVVIEGRTIAKTFWGKAWCDNLAAYSDYANRLPRGATYVRNGSVVDLVIQPKRIEALVAGSDTYTVEIKISPLAAPVWKQLKADCSASIDSLLDLLAGRLSDGVMRRLTRPKDGLFPAPKEIQLRCSCPDGSYCCKHLAAVMYGVGHRLDAQPELLFTLRDVDHAELVAEATTHSNLDQELNANRDGELAGADLGAIFGIELDAPSESSPPPSYSVQPPRKKAVAKKTEKKLEKKPEKTSEKKPETISKRKLVSAKEEALRKKPKTSLQRTAERAATRKASSAEALPPETSPPQGPKRVSQKRLGRRLAQDTADSVPSSASVERLPSPEDNVESTPTSLKTRPKAARASRSDDSSPGQPQSLPANTSRQRSRRAK